ncbi:MAG: hypothetical protein J7L42_02645 [Elusimicrobia bacterium]|nr:hypothetical protein [Elusimicrobiota bacterium]
MKKEQKKFSEEELKNKITDEVEYPYRVLKKSFEIFEKKWQDSQKAGPLEKKELNDLVLEALNEGIEKSKK